MLPYMIMRITYGLYILVAALIFYKTVSGLIFHPEKRSLSFALKGFAMAFIWPLGLFSKNGRMAILNSLPFTNSFRGEKK